MNIFIITMENITLTPFTLGIKMHHHHIQIVSRYDLTWSHLHLVLICVSSVHTEIRLRSDRSVWKRWEEAALCTGLQLGNAGEVVCNERTHQPSERRCLGGEDPQTWLWGTSHTERVEERRRWGQTERWWWSLWSRRRRPEEQRAPSTMVAIDSSLAI